MKSDNKQRLFEVIAKLDKTSDSKAQAIERLKSKEVVYMELKESKFKCGFCIFFKDGYCNNKKIKAIVSGENGCCNLYTPKNKDVVDFDDWSINK
jgi:hypothetical protein